MKYLPRAIDNLIKYLFEDFKGRQLKPKFDNIDILLSGGIDSTVLLFTILETYKHITNKGSIYEIYGLPNINVISVEPNFSGNKTSREKIARIKIKDQISNLYEYRNFNHLITYSTLKDISDFKINGFGFKQTLYWLSSLMYSLSNDKESHLLLFSYNGSDKEITYKENIMEIIHNSLCISNSCFHPDMSNYNISFPFESMYKYQVIQLGAEINLKWKERLNNPMIDILWDNITVCEDGNGDIDTPNYWCGKCNTCKGVETELLIGLLYSKDDEEYSMFKYLLDKFFGVELVDKKGNNNEEEKRVKDDKPTEEE